MLCVHLFNLFFYHAVQEISPYETKALMRVSFLGRIASNHTAFVRIKTKPAVMSDLLILPVEVEVTTGNAKRKK